MKRRSAVAGLLIGMVAIVAMTIAPAAASSGCTVNFTGPSASCPFNVAGSKLTVGAYAAVNGPTGTITATITGPAGLVLASCTSSTSSPGQTSTGVSCYDSVGVAGLATPGLASLTCSVTVSPPASYYGQLGCQSGGA